VTTKFKVGDKVNHKCKFRLFKPGVGVISRVRTGGSTPYEIDGVLHKHGESTVGCFGDDELELVTEEPVIETLEVGDLVTIEPNRDFAPEGTGRVTEVLDDGQVRYELVKARWHQNRDDVGEVWAAQPEYVVPFTGELETPVAPAAKTEAQARKDRPIARGCLDYFPDALMAVGELSRIGNEQHNPGEPMHWARGKSADHADCLVRHLIDRGTPDSDGVSHTVKVVWRALALLQTELEAADPALAALRAKQTADRLAAAKGE
jgi:hypothetical protein